MHPRLTRWPALAASSLPSSRSTPKRPFTASSRKCNDQAKQRQVGTPDASEKSTPSNPPPSTSTPSIFDQIFAGPDPFPKTESPASAPRGRLLRQEKDPSSSSSSSTSTSAHSSSKASRNDPLPREVLFDDPTDSRARTSPSASSNADRVPYARRRGAVPRREVDRSPLTTSEAAAFTTIFDSIWSGGKGRSDPSHHSPLSAVEKGGRDEGETRLNGQGTNENRSDSSSNAEANSHQDFGSSLSRNNKLTVNGGWLELHSYASRNLGARAALRDEHFARRNHRGALGGATSNSGDGVTPYNPRIAAIRAHNEGAASRYSDSEIEQGIDRARTEMAECQTVGQVWEWAAREIWGAEKGGYNEVVKRAEEVAQGEGEGEEEGADQTPVEGAEAKESPSTSPSSTTPTSTSTSPSTPRFGLSTPFYAPVLHSLFLTLRDRFQSPSSALQVLRLVRALGPSSLVLGTTALLYTEAVKTRWGHLADLRGTRDLLAEAREIGLLAGMGGAAGRNARSLQDQGQQGLGQGQGQATEENWSGAGEKEEKSLRIVVDHVRSEVRRNLLGQGGSGIRVGDGYGSFGPMTEITSSGFGSGSSLRERERERMGEEEGYGQGSRGMDLEISGFSHRDARSWADGVAKLEMPEDEASKQALALVEEMGKLVGAGTRGAGERRRVGSGRSAGNATFGYGQRSMREGGAWEERVVEGMMERRDRNRATSNGRMSARSSY